MNKRTKIIPVLLGMLVFLMAWEISAAAGIKGKWLSPEPTAQKVSTLIQLVKAPEKFSQAEKDLAGQEGWLVYRLVWPEDCRTGGEIKKNLEKLSRQLSVKPDVKKIYLDFSPVPQALYSVLDLPDFWAGLWGEAGEKPDPQTLLFPQTDAQEGYLASLLKAAEGYERFLNLRHLPWYIKEKNKRVPPKLQAILGKLKELKRKPSQYPIHWNQPLDRQKALKMMENQRRADAPPSITYVSPDAKLLAQVYWLKVTDSDDKHKPLAMFAQMGKNRLDLETINIKEIKLDLTGGLARNSGSDPLSGLSIYYYNKLIYTGPWRSLTLSLEGPLDREPPQISEMSPENGAKGVNRAPTITFKVSDFKSGVDPDSIGVKLNDVWLTPQVSGNDKEYQVMARYKEKLGFRQKVELKISVGDLADPPNVTEETLTFITEKEAPFEIRVNCGGKGYIDPQGMVWEGDQPYSQESGWGYYWEGRVLRNNHQIYDTGNPLLYQAYRYSFGDYRFRLPNGRYLVVMHYAEIGGRESRFNVKVERDTVYKNFNPYRYAGVYTALQLYHVVDLTDGELKVWAEGRKGRRHISGIEIYGLPEDKTEDTTPPEFRNWFPSNGKTAPAFTSVPISDFRNNNLVSKLSRAGIIKIDRLDPDEWVYFDQAFTSQSELEKKLEETGIADVEKILEIWRESLIPITVRVLDAESGVDRDSVRMWVNGNRVQLGKENFEGNMRALTITYYPPEPFSEGEPVSVIISVQDKAVIPNRATGELRFFVQNEQTPELVQNEILVKFKSNIASRVKDSIIEFVDGKVVKYFTSIQVYHLRLGKGISVEEAIARLEQNPSVRYAEPNYVQHTTNSVESLNKQNLH